MDDSGKNPVVRKDEKKILKLPKSQFTYELLCPDIARQMEMYMGRLKPGASTGKDNHSHTGEEVIHVLEGNMCIILGTDEYNLEAGDTIYYYSSVPHRIINKGEKELVFISAMTPLYFNV